MQIKLMSSDEEYISTSDKMDVLGYRQSLRQEYVRCQVTQRSCKPSLL